MKYADWVPEKTRRQHTNKQPSEKIRQHWKTNGILHPSLEYMEKILSCNDISIKITWQYIDLLIENIKSTPGEAKKRYYENSAPSVVAGYKGELPALPLPDPSIHFYDSTYTFLTGAITSCSGNKIQFWDWMMTMGNNLIARDIFFASEEIPSWISNYTYKQRASDNGEFNKQKKIITQLSGFLIKNDLDVNLTPLDKLDEIDRETRSELAKIRSIISALDNSEDIIQAEEHINRLTKLHSEKMELKASEALNHIVKVLDFCRYYDIEYTDRPSTNSSERNLYCYLLAEYFKKYLGAHLFEHVANIVQVTHGGDVSKEIALRAHKKIAEKFLI